MPGRKLPSYIFGSQSKDIKSNILEGGPLKHKYELIPHQHASDLLKDLNCSNFLPEPENSSCKEVSWHVNVEPKFGTLRGRIREKIKAAEEDVKSGQPLEHS